MLSTHEMTTGHGFPSGKQADEGADRDPPYQFKLALALNRPMCYRRGQPGAAIRGIVVESVGRRPIPRLTLAAPQEYHGSPVGRRMGADFLAEQIQGDENV